MYDMFYDTYNNYMIFLKIYITIYFFHQRCSEEEEGEAAPVGPEATAERIQEIQRKEIIKKVVFMSSANLNRI